MPGAGPKLEPPCEENDSSPTVLFVGGGLSGGGRGGGEGVAASGICWERWPVSDSDHCE